MKIEKLEIFGSFTTDGDGYKTGSAFGYFPFSAAAQADLAKRNLGGYGIVRKLDCIRLEDVIYILSESERDISKLIGKCSKFTTFELYEDYDYSYNNDKTKYYFGDVALLSLLKDNQRHNIKKLIGLCDDKYLYILESAEPIEMTKFAKSRELAIAHALSKLTKEEKGLLGL